MFSNIPSINEDIQVTLNLNCAAVHLPENRKAALDALKKKIFLDCKDKAATKSYFQRLYASLRSKDTLSEYLGILLHYLEKRINSAST